MIGFREQDKEKVVNFLSSLNQDQRDQFKGLISSVVSVDFSTRGSVQAKKVATSAEDVVTLAEKKMKENSTLSVEEAQKLAAKELNLL